MVITIFFVCVCERILYNISVKPQALYMMVVLLARHNSTHIATYLHGKFVLYKWPHFGLGSRSGICVIYDDRRIVVESFLHCITGEVGHEEPWGPVPRDPHSQHPQ